MNNILSPELARRLVAQALDRESLYWMDAVLIKRQPYIDHPKWPPWHDPRLFAGDFLFEVVAEDTVNEVDRGDLERSWEAFQFDYPSLASAILDENLIVPGSADLFWQFCVFGQIVYA